MQKWEYCTVGPIMADTSFEGYYPKITYMSPKGRKVVRIDKTSSMSEGDVLAQTIAKLGDEGWELVGTGGFAGTNSSHWHLIYFKRLKE